MIFLLAIFLIFVLLSTIHNMTTLHTDTLKVHIISQIMEMRDAYFLAKLDKLIQEVKEEADILQRLAKPRRKKLDIEALKKAQGFTNFNIQKMNELRQSIDLQEPIETLMQML